MSTMLSIFPREDNPALLAIDEEEKLVYVDGEPCELTQQEFSLLQELAQIRYQRDLIPIVAHIDRYISPFRTKGIPEALAKLPVLVQASGSFFTNKSTKNLALKLLRDDKIHLLGSDCHNLSSRPPNLREALSVIENKFGKNAILHINSIESGIFAVAK